MDKAGLAPVTDDAELAKVLEDMNSTMAAVPDPAVGAPVTTDATAVSPLDATSAIPGIEMTSPADTPVVDTPPTDDTTPTQLSGVMPSAETTGLTFEETPTVSPVSTPEVTVSPLSGPFSADGGDLESIKKDALTELRPLVDKLDLPTEEKFNTLLLIIRSTDDKTLVPAIHEAAKAIEDDTKRAQALLDVIKEIDFFSKPAE